MNSGDVSRVATPTASQERNDREAAVVRWIGLRRLGHSVWFWYFSLAAILFVALAFARPHSVALAYSAGFCSGIWWLVMLLEFSGRGPRGPSC